MFDTAALLKTLTSVDATRPRITYYDHHGRIELSGKVLANWVHKATGMLADEFDTQPLDVVVLDLPVGHWRTLYWALAAWATGAHVVLPEAHADAPREQPSRTEAPQVIITDRPAAWADAAAPLVAVEMAPLARSFGGDLPSGAIDEAAELASFPDDTDVSTPADPDDPALSDRGYHLSYQDLVSPDEAARVLLAVSTSSSRMQVLATMLGVLAADGSVVVAAHETDLNRLATTEQATLRTL